MKVIQLTQNKVTIVDDEDFNYINGFNWYASNHTNGSYAVRNSLKIEHKENKRTIIKMHRFILNINDKNIEVDHINCNPLDNRKENLRLCTKKQNCRNKLKPKRNTSGYKGVTWCKGSKKWRANIQFNNKNRCLGFSENIIEAAKMYDKAAVKYFGKFANTNFKMEKN